MSSTVTVSLRSLDELPADLPAVPVEAGSEGITVDVSLGWAFA